MSWPDLCRIPRGCTCFSPQYGAYYKQKTLLYESCRSSDAVRNPKRQKWIKIYLGNSIVAPQCKGISKRRNLNENKNFNDKVKMRPIASQRKANKACNVGCSEIVELRKIIEKILLHKTKETVVLLKNKYISQGKVRT